MTRPQDLADVVHRNIRALVDARRRHLDEGGPHQHVADRVTRAMGTMTCVYVHLALIVLWVVPNTGVVPGIAPWDPLPFHALGVAVGVEAIVLTLLVLVSQNREHQMAERRAELDVQINLLAEHEITKVLEIVRVIAKRLDLHDDMPAVEELEQEVDPERLLRAIELAREDD